MPATPDHDYDVAVVGAGPTGLLLAGDLAETGVRVVVLEKRDEESNLTRAFAVHARTLEHLDARGLADDLVASGHTVEGLRLFGAVSVAFTGLPTRFAHLLVTPQYHVERLLLDRCARHGAELRRGVAVRALHQEPDGVLVEYDDRDGAGTLTARYVVGTDGHHSTVRDQLGLDFPGESVVRSLMLADVQLADPPDDLLTVVGNREGFCFVVPYGDGWWRIIARDPRNELPDDAPVLLDDVRDLARRVLGTDFGMHSPRWMSRFHSDERQATHYRRGRVFLAGDAAHVHSPAGGMGMNTGLQDAANLGWKLAAVVNGWAGEELLDTYEAERKPVGATVLRTSGALIRAAMLRGAVTRRIRDTVVGLALGTRAIGERAALRISGIGVRYPAPDGQPDLVGRRAPDFRDASGTGLHQALRRDGFVLVAPELAARRLAEHPRLTVFHPVQASVPMLVRPDGYVAWAGPVGPGLAEQVGRWLGPVAGKGTRAAGEAR